jgi:hypothetical protein
MASLDIGVLVLPVFDVNRLGRGSTNCQCALSEKEDFDTEYNLRLFLLHKHYGLMTNSLAQALGFHLRWPRARYEDKRHGVALA